MLSAPALVLVTTSFPITNDGSEAAGSFVSDLAKELAALVPVRVVAPGRSSVRELWADNVEVFRYEAPTQPLSTLKAWRPTDMIAIFSVLRAGLHATKDAVEAGPTAHVFALWALPSGEWARRVTQQCGVRYSVWMLGSDVWSLGRVPILRGMLARVIRQAKNAYADGFRLAEDARDISGTSVTFLPSTRRIDLSDPPPTRSRPPYRLLFLGRWHPNKGIDLLLDALALLNDDDWDRIECVEIQGGGPLDRSVRKSVDALRAVGRPVEVGGFLSKQEAEAAIVRSDWVVIPSRVESIPVVFSDAMKLRRPVVTTPVGDLRKLVETYECGVVASAATVGAIEKTLKLALHKSSDAYSESTKRVAGEFSIHQIAERLVEACYRAV